MVFDLINPDQDLLENFLENLKNNSFTNNSKYLMKTDIQETNKVYIFTIELPGFQKKDVKVSLEDSYLVVEAHNENKNHKENKEENNIKYLRQERFQGFFKRSFYLGEGFDIKDVQGDLTEGLLKISIPKKHAKPKEKSYLNLK